MRLESEDRVCRDNYHRKEEDEDVADRHDCNIVDGFLGELNGDEDREKNEPEC